MSRWQSKADCIDRGEVFMAPISEVPKAKVEREELARAICATCPVIEQCLDYGLATSGAGFYGGMNEEERAETYGVMPPSPRPAVKKAHRRYIRAQKS